MNYKRIILDAGKRMLHSNLTVETWGNISVRDPETQKVYMTPSAMDYDECTEEDMVVCDLAGNILDGHRKPSIEKDLHLTIYRNRPHINAVIHTHPIYSMIFACTGKSVLQMTDEAAQTLGGAVQVADYGLPGTQELAVNCIKALDNNANACLLQSHGAVCIGEDVEQAFKVATVLEITARICYMAKQIGEPIQISDSNLKAMDDYAKNHYGQDK